MSDEKKAKGSRLIVGDAVKMPQYHYQAGWGKSASVSVHRSEGSGGKKFDELRNFVLRPL